MKKFIWCLLIGSFLSIVISCGSDDSNATPGGAPVTEDDFIRGADMSFLPEIEQAGYVYKNSAGQPEDALVTLKNAGVNTIRIRLWKNPPSAHSSMAEVKALAGRVRALGMKVLADGSFFGYLGRPRATGSTG